MDQRKETYDLMAPKYSIIREVTTAPRPGENGFTGGMVYIPQKEKIHKAGEDWYILTEQLIAVADGVGGWSHYGIDSG